MRRRTWVLIGVGVVALYAMAKCVADMPTPLPAEQIEVTREVEVTSPAMVTRIVEVTRPIEVTRSVEVTRLVEVTRIVEVIATAPPAPTAVPVPTAAPEPTKAIPTQAPAAAQVTDDGLLRVQDIADHVQELGGVTLTVLSATLVEGDSARAWEGFAPLAEDEKFIDVPVIGVLDVLVTNGTDKKIAVYPDQGTVVVGGEQINLTEFMFYSGDVGGELFSGVSKKGTILFALMRTPWANVADGVKLIFEVDAPFDEQLDDLADKPYYFELTLAPEKK